MDADSAVYGQRSVDLLGVVAASAHRPVLLAELDADPRDLRTLSDDLSIPRTTVRHNLDALLEADLIARTLNNDYRLTHVGRAVLAGVQEFSTYVQTVHRLAPFFEYTDPDELGLDICQLRDAVLTVAEPPTPHAPGRRFLDVIEAADTFTALAPTIPGSPMRFLDILACEATDGTVLVPDAVAEVLIESSADAASTTRLQETADDPPFGLVVADHRVFILGLDDHGKPHALIESDADSIRSWEAEILEAAEVDATPLQPDESS